MRICGRQITKNREERNQRLEFPPSVLYFLIKNQPGRVWLSARTTVMPSKLHAANKNGSLLPWTFCCAQSFVALFCQQLNVHMGACSPGTGRQVQTFSGRSRRADRRAPRLSGWGRWLRKASWLPAGLDVNWQEKYGLRDCQRRRECWEEWHSTALKRSWLENKGRAKQRIVIKRTGGTTELHEADEARFKL